jgi:ADP-dependent NAD(P)H-hydrate dehydratase / NAD(P)H-hydrate epimerase
MFDRQQLESIVVTAEQMRQIEEQIFAVGMPVTALMEKAALLCARKIQELYPLSKVSKVGILVGSGHNGGDALVIARELYLQGYQVKVCRPFDKLKDLTAQHDRYAESLGIKRDRDIQFIQDCDLIIDGLFGFGLTRHLTGEIAEAVDRLNQWNKPIVSIDIPSGLHTDTGEVLGTAVVATHSLCLGLWKQAYFQDQALAYIGTAEKIDFGILPHHLNLVIPEPAPVRQITKTIALEFLPLPRPAVTHKYKQGHLLLVCGSNRYAGGAILTALGARGSGVGMLSIAVPASLKAILNSHLPEALIIDCPETETGAIASLSPLAADFSKYDVIACGPGLTIDAKSVVETILKAECPLILDADGLNNLVELGGIGILSQRQQTTVLTPHLGEFKRLFANISDPNRDRIAAVREAAKESGAIVLLKGARTAIAASDRSVWLVPESTPALARGGSGDVLTGLIGGLLAQKTASEPNCRDVSWQVPTVATAAWWHARAGIVAAKERTELGVDAFTLSQYLLTAISGENFH